MIYASLIVRGISETNCINLQFNIINFIKPTYYIYRNISHKLRGVAKQTINFNNNVLLTTIHYLLLIIYQITTFANYN